jgi:hypothetical protein
MYTALIPLCMCSLQLPCHYTFMCCRMKVVAEGAVSVFLDHYVTARVARTTFGVHIRPLYDARDVEHRRRINKVFTDSAGDKHVPGAFSVILAKVSRLTPIVFTTPNMIFRVLVCQRTRSLARRTGEISRRSQIYPQ